MGSEDVEAVQGTGTLVPERRMRVSVVLCTYDGACFLPQLWDSLLAQTRLPDEIVVRDDASRDATWDLLQRMVAMARERGIHVAMTRNALNLGFVGNFAAALADAHGELLFLCDQDDVWHPGKIAAMLAPFERRPGLTLLHTDARLVEDDGLDLHCTLFEALEATRSELSRLHDGGAFEALLHRNLVTGATVAFRRALLASVVPFPEEWVHDEWLAINAAAVGEVDCLEQPLIDYRQHDANQIGMRKRSLSDKLARIGEGRTLFLQTVAARLEVLKRHLQKLDVPQGRFDAVSGKLQHMRARLALPPAHLRRVAPVLREAIRGRYARYSTGWRAILLDLVDSD